MRISSRTIRCVIVVIIAGVLAPLTASGQGMYLDSGQSGAGFEIGYLDGEGPVDAYSLSMGYSIRGVANPWVGIGKSTSAGDRDLRVYQIGVDHYPLKANDDARLQPVVGASFGVVDPIPGKTEKLWSVGAGAYGVLPLNPETAFYPAAYVSYTWIGGDPVRAYGANLSLVFKTGSKSKSYIRGHYVRDDDVDFVGISLGFASSR